MDTILHCNELKCRAVVNDRAVVTTCSHIFCLSCADHLDLAAPKDGQRKCPACSTFLLNLDDAVVASLNPTEDYKTSILSGLSPAVIMECAGRGLSFWAYQMAQEIIYQEYLAKSLADRYTGLTAQVESMTREMQDENGKLQAKLEGIQAENADLIDRLQTLSKAMRDKDGNSKKYKEMYEKLKYQIQNPGMESAANHEIYRTLQESNTQRDSQQAIRQEGVPQRRNGSGDSFERRPGSIMQHTGYAPRASQSISQGQRNAAPLPSRGGVPGTANSSQGPSASQSRQQLPIPTYGRYRENAFQDPVPRGTPLKGHSMTGGYQAGSPSRGLGLSANAKAGRPSQGQYFSVPGSRSGYGGVGQPVLRNGTYLP